jgi:predicted O-methyltransferase YrrM
MAQPHSMTAAQLLAQIRSGNKVYTAAGEALPLHSELPAAEGQLLQHWLKTYRPSRLLEIGLAYGISSLCIAEALAESRIDSYHIIDAFQSSQWQGVGLRHLQLVGVAENCILHEELSELCLPRLLAAGERFDFAYVDGWHSFDQALLEFFYINRMLDIGGVVVFDDVHLPGIQKVLDYVETYPCYQRLEEPASITQSLQARVRRVAGVPVVRLAAFRKTADDRRNWDWFEDF